MCHVCLHKNHSFTETSAGEFQRYIVGAQFHDKVYSNSNHWRITNSSWHERFTVALAIFLAITPWSFSHFKDLHQRPHSCKPASSTSAAKLWNADYDKNQKVDYRIQTLIAFPETSIMFSERLLLGESIFLENWFSLIKFPKSILGSNWLQLLYIQWASFWLGVLRA